jgi:hypothetical protein
MVVLDWKRGIAGWTARSGRNTRPEASKPARCREAEQIEIGDLDGNEERSRVRVIPGNAAPCQDALQDEMFAILPIIAVSSQMASK